MTIEQYILGFFVFCVCVGSIFLLLAMNNPSQDPENWLRFKFWRVAQVRRHLNPKGWLFYRIAWVVLIIGLMPVVVVAVI
jgi:hypothetical protein